MIVNRGGYTDEQITQVLRDFNGSREVDFRYDLLNMDEIKIGELEGITSARISYSDFRVIKRSVTFELDEHFRKDINFLTDRVQPWVILHMPDGGVVEWSLGIFLMESPRLFANGAHKTRSIGAYDKTLVLEQYRLMNRLLFSRGTNYVAAIEALISMAGIAQMNITTSGHQFPHDFELPVGTSAREAINILLTAINYSSLHVDSAGYVRAGPYILPSQRRPTFHYSANENSIIAPKMDESLDIAGRANVFIRVADSLELDTPLKSTFINDDINSRLSTVRRGRAIVDFDKVGNIASQSALDGLVRRLAVESTSAFRHLTFSTILLPNHGSTETLLIDIPDFFDIPMTFVETAWEMDLRVGGLMKHPILRKNRHPNHEMVAKV